MAKYELWHQYRKVCERDHDSEDPQEVRAGFIELIQASEGDLPNKGLFVIKKEDEGAEFDRFTLSPAKI